MNELEQLQQMLARVGIEHKVKPPHQNDDPRVSSVLEVQNSSTRGYSFFFSTWGFDSDGNLIEVGHYE